jgi:sulfatase modifying factor 1
MKNNFGVIVGVVLIALAGVADAQVDIGMEFVTVGDPGNPADEFAGGHGSVEYVYQIGKFEVTNAQYSAFLNDVDKLGNDPLDLHEPAMNIDNDLARPFGQKYRPDDGWENKPVTYTSVTTTQRFVNWLGGTGTERGAYDMSIGRFAPRNLSAKYFLPNRDEWHKAAYYQGPNSAQFPIYMNDYALYPTGGWTINNAAAPGDANSANYFNGSGGLTTVGSFVQAVGHYGTYDMGGNASELFEWSIGQLGGSHSGSESLLRASNSGENSGNSGRDSRRGFRVAAAVETQPAPNVPDLVIEDAVELKWQSQVGVNYQVQYSPDMKSWFDDGAPIGGTGSGLSALRSKDSERKYYRVRIN